MGIKDIFDTKDMPTHNGTVLHEGRQPDRDAAAGAAFARGRSGDNGQDRDR